MSHATIVAGNRPFEEFNRRYCRVTGTGIVGYIVDRTASVSAASAAAAVG